MAQILKKDILNHLAGNTGFPRTQKECIEQITGTTAGSLQEAWNKWAGTTSNPRIISECAKIIAGLTSQTVNTQDCLEAMDPVANFATNWSVRLWLDATTGVFTDAGTTLATNGQTIQQWNSKAGGATASQSTGASRPTFFNAVLNSRPGVFFDGTDDSLSFTQITTSGHYIIAYVATNADAANGSNILGFTSSAAWYLRDNVATTEGVKANIIGNATTTAGTTQSPHFGAIVAPLSGSATVYRNTSTSTVTTGSFLTDGVNAHATETAFLPNGFIHEVILVEATSNYPTVSTDRDALFVEIQKYLSRKWGLGIV